MHNNSRHRKDQGFTVIELMITVSIVGILATIAVPNLLTNLAEKRLKSAEFTILNVHRTARAESSIRQQPVIVRFSRVSDQEYLELLVRKRGSTAFTGNTTSGGDSEIIGTYNFPKETRIKEDAGGTAFVHETTYTINKSYAKNTLGTLPANIEYYICDNKLSGSDRRRIQYTSKSKALPSVIVGACP